MWKIFVFGVAIAQKQKIGNQTSLIVRAILAIHIIIYEKIWHFEFKYKDISIVIA